MAQAAAPLTAYNWMMPPREPNAMQGRVTWQSGNDLKKTCDADETACAFYVFGIVDGQVAMTFTTTRDVAYCIPATATAVQLKDVVTHYLEAHAESRHLPSGTLVATALREAWPQCN